MISEYFLSSQYLTYSLLAELLILYALLPHNVVAASILVEPIASSLYTKEGYNIVKG